MSESEKGRCKIQNEYAPPLPPPLLISPVVLFVVQVWPPLNQLPIAPVQLAAASSYATAVAVGQGVEAATAAAEATAKAAEEAGLGGVLVVVGIVTVVDKLSLIFITEIYVF